MDLSPFHKFARTRLSQGDVLTKQYYLFYSLAVQVHVNDQVCANSTLQHIPMLLLFFTILVHSNTFLLSYQVNLRGTE